MHELLCFFIPSGVGLLILYPFTMGIFYLIVYCVYILLFILAGMYFGPLPMCIVSSFFFASHFLFLSLLPIIPDVFQWWSAFAPAPLCCPVYVAGDRSSPSFARLWATVSPATPARIASQYCVSSTQQDQLLLQIGTSSVQLVHLVKKKDLLGPGHIPV
jgi:hypothetical protein